jgi:hypothetical protein
VEAEEVDGEVVAPFVDVVGLVDVVGVEGVAEVCSDVGEEEGEGMIGEGVVAMTDC